MFREWSHWQISLFLALVLGSGCVQHDRAAFPAKTRTPGRAEIEARSTIQLAEAWLIKPRETGDRSQLAVALAPLVLRERAGDHDAVAEKPERIFYHVSATRVRAQPRVQVSHVWEEPAPGGVRLTLDDRGLPRIWEVLSPDSKPHIAFVSASLEAAARTEFGEPYASRRFSVEQTEAAAPMVIVARLLEDAPMAMGPMVHLTAADNQIAAVICRCMPVQVERVTGTGYYELVPLTEAPAAVVARWQRALADNHPEHWLRLPESF